MAHCSISQCLLSDDYYNLCEGSRELRPPKAPIRIVSMEKRRMKWMEHSYPYASNHREAQEIGNAPETT